MNDTKEDVFTDIVEGIETPCQFAGRTKVCPDEPARWIMWVDPCCSEALAHSCVLACDTCKAIRLSNLVTIVCQRCGHVYSPASTAYTYVEPLEKK